jgi:hypothetical protein
VNARRLAEIAAGMADPTARKVLAAAIKAGGVFSAEDLEMGRAELLEAIEYVLSSTLFEGAAAEQDAALVEEPEPGERARDLARLLAAHTVHEVKLFEAGELGCG